jgi:hypothetical protein
MNSFQDAGDAGDDPWKPGCHWGFTDARCTQGKQFALADSCKDSTHLIEWTNQECHTLTDSVVHDCNAECNKRQAGGGTCVVDKDECGKGHDSAHCECDITTSSAHLSNPST